MNTLSGITLGAALLLMTGCDCGERDEFGTATGLVIERPELPEVIKHEDGTVTQVFSLPVEELMQLAANSDYPSDPDSPAKKPFSPPKTPGPGELRDLPLHILKQNWIGFPEGTSAVYDHESETLTVRQTPDWMDYIESLLDTVRSSEKNLNVRFEIYELPAVLALRLEQSACDFPEHRAEWEALQKIVESGEAEFITSCNLQTRSGQRGQVSAVENFTVFSGFEKSADDESAAFVPAFETRGVGTIAELDVVLGSDDERIDMSLKLEHHTAPPEFSKVEVPVPGGGDRVVVELPAFHMKSIETLLTIMSGDTKLLGSWRPTGKPEFEANDVMRIVFVRADVQRVGDGG